MTFRHAIAILACVIFAHAAKAERSEVLRADLSPAKDDLLFLGVDSLAKGRVDTNVLAPSPENAGLRGWTVIPDTKEVRLASAWDDRAPPRAFTLTVNTHVCYGTLLGPFNPAGAIPLPTILHLPGYGTLRVSSDTTGLSLGYASGPGWIKVTFPPLPSPAPRRFYRLSVTTVFPSLGSLDQDARLDGYRRNWLNVLQLNPNRKVLSNNSNSDTCGFCYYEYADIARLTPTVSGSWRALDIVRQSVESVLNGSKTYGMPGYGDFPVESSDLYPSLLIAADDYAEGARDLDWARAHYAAIRAMAEKMLATDTSGNGLVKYAISGNSGIWNEGQPKVRPSNWWDTVGFGYEDAYANALAYRALGGMSRLAGATGAGDDSARYAAAARKLHDAYFGEFYDPATGILAGWRSADGELHDYWFTYVNGIAVLYGLVPEDKAKGIMDRIWDKMADVGYTRFRMGLPGNLVPVARKDYAHKHPRWGGGVREDNLDGFQVYENGGAPACFSYFAIAAFNKVGEKARAEEILLPMLDAFEDREFEGTGSNGMTNDWRKWDGTAEGYEGFLVDNYYALLAVPEVYGSR